MPAIRTFTPWAATAVVLAACSGSGTTASTVTADQAATNAATALCAKYNTCSAFFIQLEYGDVGACTSAAKTALANALGAPSTGASPAQIADCATAIPGTSCDDVLSHNLPTSCQAVAGALATGTPCGDSSQCKSAYCHQATGTTCGACADPPAAGASCAADGDCPVGSTCSKGGKCASPGAAGASCDPVNQPCKATLACKSGTCGTPDAAGASCTKATTNGISTDTCDSLAGLYCNAQGTCAAIELATPGQPCLLVNGGLTTCSGNGTCNIPSKLATSGTCLAAAAPGASCTAKGTGLSYAVSSADCAPPAICENGVCTVADAASCH
jgi:hypothetical protein